MMTRLAARACRWAQAHLHLWQEAPWSGFPQVRIVASGNATDKSMQLTAYVTPANGGTITGYAWTQISGPPVHLLNADTRIVTVMRPEAPDEDGSWDTDVRCTVTEESPAYGELVPWALAIYRIGLVALPAAVAAGITWWIR